MQTRYIYGLYDPRNPDVVMCVGETKQALTARLSSYIADARRGRKKLAALPWIQTLLAQGIKPQIKLLAVTDDRNWRRCERRFISIWRKRNPALVNRHRGGNGTEDGKPKVFCDKCGTQRKRYECGLAVCPKCLKAYQTEYRKTRNGRESQRKTNATPQAIARRITHGRTAKAREWMRDYYPAKQAGFTVAQYRLARKLRLNFHEFRTQFCN